MDPALARRLDKYTDKTGECWVWTGGTFSSGHPRIRVGDQSKLVRGVVWEEAHGPKPATDAIWHQGDRPGEINRLCVRVDHLVLGRKGRPPSDRQYVEERLLNNYIETPDGCWEWQGSRHGFGHGLITVNRKTLLVPRVAAWLWMGLDLDSDVWVLHHCDNPPCYNPNGKHIYLGNRGDNLRDAVVRGRLKGERNANAKLSAAQVEEIRTLYAEGAMTQSQLGAEFGVNQATVSQIVRRQNWKD